MVVRVIFISRERASAMKGRSSAALISIKSPQEPTVQFRPGWHSVLRLSFDDVDTVTFPGQNADLITMSPGDGSAIANFVRRLPAGVLTLVVHCRAGISRSGGVAKGIAESLALRFPNDYAEYNRMAYLLVADGFKRLDECQ